MRGKAGVLAHWRTVSEGMPGAAGWGMGGVILTSWFLYPKAVGSVNALTHCQ